MSLNSFLFLFLFLPICLPISFINNIKIRNILLLLASLLFYLWADLINFPLIIVLVIINFIFAQLIERRQKKLIFSAIIIINLLTLLSYKLIAIDKTFLTIITENTNWIPIIGKYVRILDNNFSFPIGLSFITFQLISYILDVHYKKISSEKNIINFSLYIFLFPKVTAGPITRYPDFKINLNEKNITTEDRYEGIKRFVIGLMKKALIADRLSLVTDHGAFDSLNPDISIGIAWILLLCYSLQIYIDFSAYTDMAIGLGRIFGFHLPENFNVPYISQSISEFWRRWHISLSSWFREYLFYPLEINRARNNSNTQILNIILVFFLTGVWHGLGLNFLIWGLIHGISVAFESTGVGKKLKNLPNIVQHMYALAIITTGWIFFRTPTPSSAIGYIHCLIGGCSGKDTIDIYSFPPLETSGWISLIIGIILSIGLWKKLVDFVTKKIFYIKIENRMEIIKNGLLIIGILLSLISLAGLNFRGYIYAGF